MKLDAPKLAGLSADVLRLDDVQGSNCNAADADCHSYDPSRGTGKFHWKWLGKITKGAMLHGRLAIIGRQDLGEKPSKKMSVGVPFSVCSS